MSSTDTTTTKKGEGEETWCLPWWNFYTNDELMSQGNNNPVTSVTGQDIVCNANPSPAEGVCSVPGK